MRTIRRLAHAGLAFGLAFGLSGTYLQAATPAQAAAIVVVSDAAKKKNPKVTLSLAKKTATYGTSVKARVTVTYGKKKLAGKVALYDGKKKLKTLTLKKGTGSYLLPKSLKPGKHTIKAKYAPSKAAAKTYKARWSPNKTLTIKVTRHKVKLAVTTNPTRFTIGQPFTLTISLRDTAKSAYPKPAGKARVEVFGYLDSQTYENVPVVGGKASIDCSFLSYSSPKTVRVTFSPTGPYYKAATLLDTTTVYPGPIITYF